MHQCEGSCWVTQKLWVQGAPLLSLFLEAPSQDDEKKMQATSFFEGLLIKL